MKHLALNKQSGLSLVEIMVAITLGIFLTAGMIKVFTSTKQTYRLQENLSRLQENGRFAINFLQRDLLIADYWGCANDSSMIQNHTASSDGFDNYQASLQGTDDDGINNSDSITVIGGQYSDYYVSATPASETASIELINSGNLEKDNIVVISDCSAGDIFKLTANPSVASSGNSEISHGKTLTKVYSTDSQVYEMAKIKYDVQIFNNQPTLYKKVNELNAQPMIEGIENIQIQYGVDTDDDFSPNFYSSRTGLTQTQLDQAVSIQISIVAVTFDDNLSTAAVPYTINGNTITPEDKKIRRVFSTTLALRNRLP